MKPSLNLCMQNQTHMSKSTKINIELMTSTTILLTTANYDDVIIANLEHHTITYMPVLMPRKVT